MGKLGYIPYKVELWAPTYNWWRGPSCTISIPAIFRCHLTLHPQFALQFSHVLTQLYIQVMEEISRLNAFRRTSWHPKKNRSISICVTVQVQMLFFISPTSINVTISDWECRAKIGESLPISLHMCVHISFQWFTPPVPLSRCHLTSRCLKVMATCFFQWDMQRDWHRKTNNTAECNS